MTDPLLRAGAIGTLITALCCFTPILGLTLAAIGLAAVVGYLDYVLLPLLGLFLLLLGAGLVRQRRAKLPR